MVALVNCTYEWMKHLIVLVAIVVWGKVSWWVWSSRHWIRWLNEPSVGPEWPAHIISLCLFTTLEIIAWVILAKLMDPQMTFTALTELQEYTRTTIPTLTNSTKNVLVTYWMITTKYRDTSHLVASLLTLFKLFLNTTKPWNKRWRNYYKWSAPPCYCIYIPFLNGQLIQHLSCY